MTYRPLLPDGTTACGFHSRVRTQQRTWLLSADPQHWSSAHYGSTASALHATHAYGTLLYVAFRCCPTRLVAAAALPQVAAALMKGVEQRLHAMSDLEDVLGHLKIEVPGKVPGGGGRMK